MFALDATTMFLALVTVHIALGLVVIVGLRRQRKREDGLLKWGYAMFSGGIGLFLLIFRDVWPDFLTKSVANCLVSLEMVFMYLAVCAYFGVRVSWFWKYAPPVLSAILFALFVDQAQRNIGSGLIHGTQFVPIALVMIRQGFASQKALRLMFLGALVLMATQFWARAIGNIWHFAWVHAAQKPAVTDPITLLIAMCVVVISTATIWLMHWDRSEGELRVERDKARRVSADKTRFLAAASHDLRQPIQALSLYLQALGSDILSAEQRALHSKMTIVTEELGVLLGSLLNVAQLDAGGVVPRPVPVSLNDLFTRLDEEFAPSATQKGLRWKLHWPANAPTLYADYSLLFTMLGNLVANAIKYTARGGVLVTARMRGRRVLLQVWDTGIGIAEEHREQLFDEFFQVGNQARAPEQGVGLGLSIVKRLAALLHCELNYRSVVRRGTVFSVLLPSTPDMASSAPAILGGSVACGKQHGVSRVIIVEDNDSIADALGHWAKASGLHVVRFTNGEDAMRQQDVSRTDCFLVDYRLAGQMTGFEFLVQRSRASGPVRGAIITGEAIPSMRYLSDCTWQVLSKPVSPQQLQSVLHSAPGSSVAPSSIHEPTEPPTQSMAAHGRELCYSEYPEFAKLPFSPAVFGFSEDCSNRHHARRCPCFATNSGYILWWSWADAATRGRGAPTSRFVITRGKRGDVDAEVVFEAQQYSELVRHLLTTPYVRPRPILDGPWPDELAREFFGALATGGFLRGPDSPILAGALKLSALGSAAGDVATAYIRAIEARRGIKALPLATQALANADNIEQ